MSDLAGDDDDHELVLSGMTAEDILRNNELWNRGDLLVTLCLGAMSEAIAENHSSAQEGLGQLKELIADDPDPTDLIYRLVLSIAFSVMNAASAAKLEPLEYWQQQQLKATGRRVRSAEQLADLRWDDIAEDLLEEERRLRERRERQNGGDDPAT